MLECVGWLATGKFFFVLASALRATLLHRDVRALAAERTLKLLRARATPDISPG